MINTNMVLMGQPSLYQKSTSIETIDETVKETINTMRMVLAQQQAVGLAAPQIGCNRIEILAFHQEAV